MSSPVLSDADAAVFGFPIARASVDTVDDITAAERFAREHDARLLVTRCRTRDVPLVQALLGGGYVLMDTQVRFTCRLAAAARRQADSTYPVRAATETDVPALRQLVRNSFGGFPSHYHANVRLDRDKCDEVYVHWVLESLQAHRPGESVFVAEGDEGLTGFGLFRVRDGVGHAMLGGTGPAVTSSRAFVFGALLREGVRGAVSNGCVRGLTSTNVANFVVQHLLIRGRWMPTEAIHTLHRWLDE